MKLHAPAMQFSPEGEAIFAKSHEANKDCGYGMGVIRFASEWATRMEQVMGDTPPESLPEQIAFMVKHAQQQSSEADDEGITGFMYGAAVSILSACWKYGEALRRWHNKELQIGTEGDEANDSGGVLNPAVLCIG